MEWRRSAGFTLIAMRTLLANYPTRHRWMFIALIVCASHQPLLELWLSDPERSLCNIGTPSTRLRSWAVSQRSLMDHLGTKRGLATRYSSKQSPTLMPIRRWRLTGPHFHTLRGCRDDADRSIGGQRSH